jgi:hypothetical protein
MASFNEMKKIKDKVKYILENRPNLRDDDNRLIASFYVLEIGKETVEEMTAMDILTKLAYGNLTSPESIRRVRQKLQEENKELRGAKYYDRLRDGQEMRDDIKKL